MTAMTMDRARTAAVAAPVLTAAESAISEITAAFDTLTAARPIAPVPAPTTADATPEPPAPRQGLHGDNRTPVRPRLVPGLARLPRPVASTGPGHTRPPTIDERILARRRAALAAERASVAAEATLGAAPTTDPTSVCCSLVLAAVEALAGTRPLAQLARWVTPEVYEGLSMRATLSVRVLGAVATARRPEVRRVRVCRIGNHVAEAGVVLDDGRRVRAVAVRLESWRGAWRAVALEIG